MMTSSRWIWTATALLGASCGASPGTRPDDMGAAEHHRAAGEEDVQAEGHAAQYDPQAGTIAPSNPVTSELFYGPEVYNPTARHGVEADHHRRLAQAHRAAAGALEAYEEQQCGRFPAETRAACPFANQVIAVEDVPHGVAIRFAGDVNVDAAADHVRCHIAFARTQGREGMPECPLYLAGVEAATSQGGVTLTVASDELLPELRRRSRAHVGR